MLKFKLVLYRTTLLSTKIFSHHDVGIWRDLTKDTSSVKANNAALLFCIPDTI